MAKSENLFPHGVGRRRKKTGLGRIALQGALLSAFGTAVACAGGKPLENPGGTGGQSTGGRSTGGAASAGESGAGGATDGGQTSSGSASSGGAPDGGASTGGLASSGGVSSGGAPDGGASSGGASSGGAPDGGASSGGASTGGASTGGAPDGGASSGGISSGGSPDGGASSGGTSSGGAPDGGASSGGAAGGEGGQLEQVVAGGNHTCARFDSGAVKCWGANSYGELGLGDTVRRGDQPGEMGAALPPVDLGPGAQATLLAAGQDHTCARLQDGSVKCWGRNGSGQLGLGDTSDRGDGADEMGANLPPADLGTGRTAVQLSAGDNHTCALLDDASLKCWGGNSFGKLGLGDISHRGDEPDEMGDQLPSVDLGTGRTALGLDLGDSHSCALLDDGTVKCWGNGNAGMLGQGDEATRGGQAGQMGDNLPAIDLGTGRLALRIAAGDFQTCTLLDDASLKCWGQNLYGTLGLGDTEDRGDAPTELGDALPSVQLGSERTAESVSIGNGLICALLDDSTLKCWGRNYAGELGLGDVVGRGGEPGDMGDNLPAIALGSGRSVVAVSCAYSHSCALLDDGSLKCWGSNGYGELGLGDTNARGDAPGEMGDALPTVPLF